MRLVVPAWAGVLLVIGCGPAPGGPDDAGPGLDAPADARAPGDALAPADAALPEDAHVSPADAALDAPPPDARGLDATIEVDAELRDGGSSDAPPDAGPSDAGPSDAPPDAGPPDAPIDGAWVDPCASVACPGDACRTGLCDPRSGECIPGPPRADGTPCDDGDLCTRLDACAAGACAGASPVVCPPADACHARGTCIPATGACSSAPIPCTTEVVVRVLDARGAPLATPPIVRAFAGTTAQPQGGVADARGEIRLLLPGGSYRFRAQRDGVPFWSGATDHCTMPACTFVEMRLPDAAPERVVTWDPRMDGAYDGMGEISPPNPHLQRGGTYLENWGIERYGRADAFVSGGHTHIYPQSWDPPDPYGNPTAYENQHALGEILQGIYVRLADRARFDLVSIDYRVRADTDPEHVSAIPGADPANVEIWISTSLTVPTTTWRRYPTGRAIDAGMTHWSAIFPTELTDVTGVFITTTGNVSLDDVVLRPR